ncbi:MAG: phosphate transport system regulatory protein PhoU [Lysobacteraceae bacterium SCN 69-123]|nr:MAG: phosphate transport system regulatory protein PhoU [Xanthomonadaceae bacterium SCN 69-123]OJY94488.1 MAG: phosphate transport system regulatory protein PhoU [Xanthomonadales bacterium 63-13]
MTDHIVQAFDTELGAITQQISELGQLAERQLTDAVWALRHASTELAESVKAQDQELDRLAARIEDEAISLIARRQPLAVDLRHVMAAIRIAANLERTGDLASNIAKRALALAPNRLPEVFAEPLQRMADLALLQLHDAREAFVERDAARAQGVWEHDATIDTLHTMLFQDIVQAMADDQAPALDLAHLLFVIKNIERIGDHATNIAENVVYLVSGAAPTQERPKQDESSSLAHLPAKP